MLNYTLIYPNKITHKCVGLILQGFIIQILYMDLDKSSKVINKLYDKLTYFDIYGGSLIGTIILTIIILGIIQYVNVLQQLIPIKKNWQNERCNPKYIPFAAFINKPDGVSITDYTQQNFEYCTQSILTDVSQTALLPLTYIIQGIVGLFATINSSMQSIRTVISNITDSVSIIIKDILDRLISITIPLRQIMLATSDILGKTTGTLVVGIYSIVSIFDVFNALFGAVIEILALMIIPIHLFIALCYATFMYPLAIASQIYELVLIIFIGIMAGIQSIINGNLATSSSHCFDKNTELNMDDGSFKKIKDIQVGDILQNKNVVTDKLTLSAKSTNMYNLNNIIISGDHYVNYNKQWIQVKNHPNRKRIYNYSESIIYCISTSSKRIWINNQEYLDWDDLTLAEDDLVMTNPDFVIKERNRIKERKGIEGNQFIYLSNNSGISNCKQIKDIKIGDILSHGEKVVGTVEIIEPNTLAKKQYHLITDKQSFYVNNTKIYHYD